MHVHFIGEPDDGMSISSHHARALADWGVEVSFDDGQTDPRRHARRADVIHVVIDAPTDALLLRRLALLRLRGKAIVRYWSGRDVLWAKYDPASRVFARALVRLGAVQLARTPPLVEELARIGVAAQAGPVVSVHLENTSLPEPLPATFTVLCSLPTARREFCGGKWVDGLIRRLPQVRFLILGDSAGDYSPFRNVESLGTTDDIARTIKRSTVVLQPRMDGVLSRLSLEALCHGRHVIATHSTPHTQYAGSLEAFLASIRALERDADFNLAGREYVCREYALPQTARRLLGIIQDHADPQSGGGRRGRWRTVLMALGGAAGLSRSSSAPPDPQFLPTEAAAFVALLEGSGGRVTDQPAEAMP